MNCVMALFKAYMVIYFKLSKFPEIWDLYTLILLLNMSLKPTRGCYVL